MSEPKEKLMEDVILESVNADMEDIAVVDSCSLP